MLLCILTLPPLCGIYAYLIGLGLSFLLTALCNLTFLRKQCAVLQKGRGQVRVERLITPLLLILPITLFGKITDGIFSRFLGELLALGCSALCMAGLTFLLYLLCGLVTLSDIKQRLFAHKRKNGET